MPEARYVHPRLVGMLISTLLLVMPKRSSAFASASMGVMRRGLTSSGRPRLRAASSCADDQPLRRSPAAAWLLSGVKGIHGIGPKNVEYLKKLQIATVMDLLLHLPVSVIDWGRIVCLRDVKEGDVVTLQLRVKKHSPPLGRRMPLVIHCEDGEGQAIDLLFFVQRHTWQHVARVYDVGSVKIVRGRIGLRRFGKASFSMAGPETYRDRASPVEPVYKLTAGIKPTKLRDQILAALERMPAVDDWLDEQLRRKKGWPRFDEALRLLHNPRSEDDLHPLSKASERLAFDELLATQIPLVMRKLRKVHSDGEEGLVRPIVGDGHLTQRCIERLPYELTQSQREAVEAIWKDLGSPYQRMNRLLQGDVGSGKTVCALLAMLRAVEGGGQAALLAPTEILVNQHYETLQQLCEGLMVRRPCELVAEGDEAVSSPPTPPPLTTADAASEDVVVDGGVGVISSDGDATAVKGERPLRIEVLTGALKGKARKALLEDLKNGDIDILVGTHALFSESTVFKDLALAVIDEEQRWGVNQREKLSKDTHVLSMSATPIARTFLLTLYGNYDVSRLTCRPHGEEVEVTTSVMALTKADETISGLKRLLFTDAQSADKEKVFWVLPCVGNEGSRSSAASTDPVVMSVTRRFQILVEAFGEEHVRMMHGRMDPESKRRAIKDFSEGTACVLVATSVVEVGVDVPDASVIIVERADRFGLLQLHQLRGRIGRPRPVRDRGKERKRKCHCLLLYDPTSSSPDKDKERLERLTQLKKTTDGFEIAELDYKLRGPGEVLGSRQSGFKGFKLVDLARHSELLEEAHTLAHTHARQLQDVSESPSSAISHSLDLLLTLFKTPDTLVVEKTRRERRISTSTSVTRRSKLLSSGASASAGSTIGTITTTTVVSEEAVPSLRGGVVGEGEAVTEVDSTISYSPAESVELSRQSIGLRSGGSVEIARPLATKEEEEEEEIEVEVVGVGSNSVAVPTVKWEVDLVAMRNELVFVLFDTETTGVGNTDSIIQIAAKVIDDATVEGYQRQVPYTGPLSFSEYVYPRQRISAGAIQVTGITHEFLAKQGAQPFERVWLRFAQWLNSVRGERGVVLIAHQASFDMRMLMQDFREINLDGTALREDAGVVAVLDTLTLLRAKELWPEDVQPPPRHRLGVVYEHLMGQPLQQAHCAMHDVLGLEAILLHPYIRTNWMRIAGKKCLSRVVPITNTEPAETKATRTRRQSPLATARSTLSM